MGAYADLASLVALQFKAGGFALARNRPVHSFLFGRRSSHVRGRGLDFEELRSYVLGDDVRSIDWRVTARSPKPYVRVYSEERDRPTMLVVDQRINMFFGTRRSMKSVVAAEIAALAAWRVYHQGDRIGAVIFNDTTIEQLRMHRSRAAVLRLLSRLSDFNQQLRSDYPSQLGAGQLNRALENVARVCHHDTLIVIASDFDGADRQTRDLLLGLSRSNDVICCFTYDAAAVRIPSANEFVVSDGKLQIELKLGQEKVRKDIVKASDQRMKPILAWQHELGIPVLQLSTADDVAQQAERLLGQIARRGRQL
jgi:uncharacterized protein (DUF58 family)